MVLTKPIDRIVIRGTAALQQIMITDIICAGFFDFAGKKNVLRIYIDDDFE